MTARWLAVVALVAACAVAVLPGRAGADDVIRFSLSPNLGALPFFVAVDKGYFAEQHLDVQIRKTKQSDGTLLPMLARGDIDVAPAILTPAFFNQYYEGFGLRIIAPIDSPHVGWNDGMWLVVRQDVWDAKAIRTFGDLRGKELDDGAVGSPIDFITKEAVFRGGLTTADVKFSARVHSPLDWVAVLRNKALDAVAVVEPAATLIESQGLGHKWMSSREIAPWYQASYVATSATFAAQHRDALARFIAAYTKACRYVAQANGKWTPELIDEVVKWTEMPQDVVAQIPGPGYPGGLAPISPDSVERTQALWLSEGLIAKSAPVGGLIDASFSDAARKGLRVK
jgi:NitT/TauT family transport system substrate-binding protein